MYYFVAGFIVALLTVVPLIVLFLHKKTGKVRKVKNGHSKKLEELSRLTGELTHEIKNPLSIIKVNLKLITEELEGAASAGTARAVPGSSERRFKRALRKMAVIRKETDRLEQILDGFLQYIGGTELQLADVDISELMSDMVDFYLPQAHGHSITLRQKFYSEPLICKIDADMLKQAVLNLFINAQQAMKDGGELIVRTDRRKENAVIQISDTGSGIASDKLPDIFNAYYSSRSRGSGLGLPTAKKIVEAHNGAITVDSEVGKGTLFTIKLPLVAEKG